MAAQSGCLACHKIGENGNGGPGPDADGHRRQAAEGRDPAHAGEPDRADAVVSQPRPGEEGRAGRLPRAVARRGRSGRRSRVAGRLGLRRGPHGHARGGPGAGDVRSHRARLRPHELRHDGGAPSPLARARRRPRRRRPGRPGARRGHRAPATSRSRSPAASRPGGEVIGSDFSEGMLAIAREKAPVAARGSGATRWTLPYEDGAFAAATVGLRGAQLQRPRPRAGRDGARGAPRRPRRGARDHHAAAAAAVDVLLDLVRPRRARRRPAWPTRTPTRTCPSSVKRFPGPEALAARMAAAGLDDVRWILTAGGIIAVHAGTVR